MTIKGIKDFELIRSLSLDTLNKMFNKPEQTVERVRTVANEALKRLPNASDSGLFLSFYDSVVKLDQEFFARNKTHPFADLIQRMSAQLPPEIKAKIRKEQRFREKLASLDLNSPDFNRDMQELKSLLTDLSKLGMLSPNETKNYENCFRSIQNRFKTGVMESRANEIVSKMSPAFKKGLDNAHTLIRGIDTELTSQMVRSLKEYSEHPLSEMAAAIEKKHSNLLQHGVQRRVECAISQIVPQNNTFNKTFIQNFLRLVPILDTFHTTARPLFEDRWAKTLEVLQTQTEVPLDPLFTHYPNLSKEEFIPELCAMAELKYTRGLTLDVLCSPALFEEYFKRTNHALSEKLGALYDANYKKHMLDPHAWFTSYADSIKKPYSQAADIHLNLEDGTCFQNSLDRLSLLLKTPNLKAENIRMGSTQEGRATQARVKYTYSNAKVGLISIEKATELQAKSCERLGLTLSGETPACTTPKELIKFLSPKKDFLGILTLASPEGAHAIDVQIDHKRKIFRFIDDNTGIVEMDNYESFVTGFKTYLESLYPEFLAFKFETFNRA